VTFPIAAALPPLGLYNVVTQQADCATQVLVDGFTITCGNPSSFTQMVPNSLQGPQGAVQLRIKGAALEELDSVSLAQGALVIPGESPTMDGSDLLATFDFTDKPAGDYNLVGARPGDACPDPATLVRAFRLLPEVPCTELLLNGDFEAEGPQPPNTTLGPSSGWTNGPPHPNPWISLRYNEDIPNHTNSMPTGPVAGANYAATHTGNGDLARIYQTVGGASSGAELRLSGFMFGCSNDLPGNPDRRFNHHIKLWDGSLDGGLLASWVMPDAQHCTDWVPFSIVGTPTGATVTVEWGWQRTSDRNWAVPATYMDEVSLCKPKLCNDPFADFDGDDDVDQEDFAFMQRCYNPLGLPDGCLCADADRDLAVDTVDMNAFDACASGPSVAANPLCDGT